MSNHTHINLSDVQNMAEKFGMAPDLEARFASGALELEKSGLSYQKLAPNFRMPFGHRHQQQEEIYVVIRGGGRMNVDGEVFEVRELDAVRVPPELPRSLEAGPDGIEILAYGAPRTGEVAQDAEQLPGWWDE
jgi:mannose-6-phosphate isomerase-like protein (cupin superfamily)